MPSRSAAGATNMCSATAEIIPWIAPEITPTGAHPHATDPAADLDRIQREAWDAGFARGLEAGEAAAISEQRPQLLALKAGVDRLASILDLLSTPLADLDKSVEDELANLACAIARHVVRRELQADPAQIIAAVRHAVSLLPSSAREVRIHLHPEDAALVRERLAEPNAERAWILVEDPVLERGGCRVNAEHSQVDARVETRLGAAIAAVLGEKRARGDGRA